LLRHLVSSHLWLSVEQISKTCLDAELFNSCIRVLSEWIKIEPESTSEESWVLSDDSDLLSYLSDVDLVDIDSIDQNMSIADLYYSGESLRDG